jgi:hypothetical protein
LLSESIGDIFASNISPHSDALIDYNSKKDLTDERIE